MHQEERSREYLFHSNEHPPHISSEKYIHSVYRESHVFKKQQIFKF